MDPESLSSKTRSVSKPQSIFSSLSTASVASRSIPSSSIVSCFRISSAVHMLTAWIAYPEVNNCVKPTDDYFILGCKHLTEMSQDDEEDQASASNSLMNKHPHNWG